MKSRWNTWLLLGTIVPLVLHFWPFAYWSGTTLVILRIIPALCAQALLCRIEKHAMLKVLPLIITGALAAWGSYLYFTSPRLPYAAFRISLAGSDRLVTYSGCSVFAYSSYTDPPPPSLSA